MKKGFTLVELLAVLVILSVVIVIAGTSYSRINKKNRKNQCENLKLQVKNAATEYFNDYYHSEDFDNYIIGKNTNEYVKVMGKSNIKCKLTEEIGYQKVNGSMKKQIIYKISCNVFLNDLILNGYLSSTDQDNIKSFIKDLDFQNSYVIFINKYTKSNNYDYKFDDFRFYNETGVDLSC